MGGRGQDVLHAGGRPCPLRERPRRRPGEDRRLYRGRDGRPKRNPGTPAGYLGCRRLHPTSRGRAVKVATFSVRASMPQSIAWKRAAEAEGFPSVGSWAANALDAYLKIRAKAGIPLPLAWRLGRFPVALDDGAAPELRGWVSPPFGIFHGTGAGPIPAGSTHLHTLVYLSARRIVATFKTTRQCKALAAELAGVWARHGGEAEDIRAGPLIERHEREAM